METYITAEFRHRANAEEAIAKIRQRGEDSGLISLTTLAHLSGEEEYSEKNHPISKGSAIGGITGLAVGFSTIAIPSLGAFAAAGPIAGLLSGTALGGIVGSLLTPEELPQEKEEALGGRVLFSMPVTRENAGTVSKILKDHTATLVELQKR